MVHMVTRLQGQNTGVSVPRLSTYSRLPSPRATATGWKNPFPPRVSCRPIVWLYWNVNGSICVTMFTSHRYPTYQVLRTAIGPAILAGQLAVRSTSSLDEV